MRPQIQNGPDCLITAAAMILDVPVHELKAEMKYDSLERKPLEKGMKAIETFRGCHTQEVVDLFLKRSISLVEIHVLPALAPNTARMREGKLIDDEDCLLERFSNHLEGNMAILVGYRPSGEKHAWAWDGSRVIDPKNGHFVDIENLPIEFALVRFD